MKTIVALVDFTHVTTKILKLAETLALAMHSRVILLHVVPPEPAIATLGSEAPIMPEPATPEQVAMEKERLRQLLNSLSRSGVNAAALQFEGQIVAKVMEETQKVDADLVIMGSHHHSMFYNLLIGSLTAELLKRLPMPVLVVPADMPVMDKQSAKREHRSTSEFREDQVLQPVLSA